MDVTLKIVRITNIQNGIDKSIQPFITQWRLPYILDIIIVMKLYKTKIKIQRCCAMKIKSPQENTFVNCIRLFKRKEKAFDISYFIMITAKYLQLRIKGKSIDNKQFNFKEGIFSFLGKVKWSYTIVLQSNLIKVGKEHL